MPGNTTCRNAGTGWEEARGGKESGSITVPVLKNTLMLSHAHCYNHEMQQVHCISGLELLPTRVQCCDCQSETFPSLLKRGMCWPERRSTLPDLNSFPISMIGSAPRPSHISSSSSAAPVWSQIPRISSLPNPTTGDGYSLLGFLGGATRRRHISSSSSWAGGEAMMASCLNILPRLCFRDINDARCFPGSFISEPGTCKTTPGMSL
ncbi:hypothetical protein P152DRAFT_55181 [Eremomyces bilateralis CBS 781.70]|uniref:Uncharacterized protein n=1 Tax=Eremomyces bilateralis CBS 781.70 TaxID=1392243 RepID=A0A6G1G062_9PEZI|nr:uncharacterized protein P152DRAFT_55181 [Eremomyces bilateralis CBS 781.70]KAF1811408.1 hypothetical protein P152DRAFT_55181 [Eremomyces bilateralis CBS 781.70]